ncbi:MAG: 4-hydroxy-tetrahydrodipicolinate reductase [Alphaproteobacteria bacterium]
MTDMRLVVAGAGGRMGRTLVRAIAAEPGVVLEAAIEQSGSPFIGEDSGEIAGLARNAIKVSADAKDAMSHADGIIDFTSPSATVSIAAIVASAVHVIGTTGLSDSDYEALDEAALSTTIIQSGNMSLGVNLLAQFVRQAASALDPSFDIEISELHHRDKVDAPSGTALLFGREAAVGRGIDLDERSVRGRDGHIGARRRGDIGFAASRGGTIVGDHSVIFAGDGETIELTHRALDRSIFARGAIKAALWGRDRDPGRYTMADVLGLKPENLS